MEQLVAPDPGRPGGGPPRLPGKKRVDEPLDHPAQLPLRKRPQGQHLHPPGQRLGQFRQQHHIRGTGEQKAPRLPPAVDGRLDDGKDLGGVLHLVQGHGAGQTGDETVGIAPGRGQKAGIVKRQVLAAGARQFLRPRQGAFAGLAGAVDQHGRGVLESLEEAGGDMAANHGRIINQMADDNQPLSG